MTVGKEYTGVGVCFYCHDGQGNVLMSLRGVGSKDENGRWDIGGGRGEFGEKIEDTLAREIKEEYLTDIIEKEFLGYRDVMREQHGAMTHWVVLDFKVLVEKAKAGNGEPHKFDEVKWFRKDALPLTVHSQLPIFLSKYVDRL